MTRLRDRATEYARAVAAGTTPAGPHVRDACARHLRDLDRTDGAVAWDLAKADRAIRYFEEVLRLNGGEHEGQPFVLLDWQAFIVGSLFGWMGDDGQRRFRTAYVESGKGSGKSPLAAGIGLYMLTADQEPRAEVYAAAAQKDQAQILFRDAVAMWKQSPKLQQRLKSSGGDGKEWNLYYSEAGSFFRTIASDTAQSGLRPHCALIDEVHEHHDDTVVKMLRAGTKGRRQALIFMITNSGARRMGVCWDNHEYGRKVAAGEMTDDAYFAYICALDAGDEPLTDESCWAKANPSLGQTFGPKYLRELVTQARGMPSAEAGVLRLNFCEWTDAEAPWIDKDLWDASEADFDPNELRGLPCFGALDLSEKRDLSAFSAVWRVPEGLFDWHAAGGLAAATWFWTPGDTLDENGRKYSVPYKEWVQLGYLLAPPGRIIDQGFIAEFVKGFAAEHDLQTVAFDQHLIDAFRRSCDYAGWEAWVDDRPRAQDTGKLEGDAGVGQRLRRHGQGWNGAGSKTAFWMPNSVTTLEGAIVKGNIRILRNPVMRWNSASAVLSADPANNRKWNKQASTGKIDGMVSMTMAVGAADEELLPPPVDVSEALWFV